jgi:SulP family sulfate permease
VLFSSLSTFAEPGSASYVTMALTVAFMVGLIEVTMALFRLGTIVNFISHSVVISFTAAAGVLIAINQVKNFFGLAVPRGGHAHDVVFHFASHLHEISLPATIVGLATVVIGLVSRRWAPRVP